MTKNMFNLDDEMIEFRALLFWQGTKAENVVFFISDEIRGSYCLKLLVLPYPNN